MKHQPIVAGHPHLINVYIWQALLLLPLYAFAFAMWQWERKAIVDSRFTGQDGESAGGSGSRGDTGCSK